MFKKAFLIVSLVAIVFLAVRETKSEAGPIAGSACCTAMCLIESAFPPLAAICTGACIVTVGASFPSLGICSAFFAAPTP